MGLKEHMRRKRSVLDADSYSIRAVQRAIAVLSCFSFERQRLTLGEFVKLTGLSKPTLFRILQNLELGRFVSYDQESHSYSLGMKILELGRVAFRSHTLNVVASHFLDALAAKSQYPVGLAVLSDGEIVYVDQRKGTEHVQLFGTEIGKRRPPHFGAHGLVHMAHLAEEEVNRLLEKYPLVKLASRSITDPVLFKKRLKEVLKKGYGYEESEIVEGLIAVAAPVRNHRGDIIASVETVLPSAISTPQRKQRMIEQVLEAAKGISEGLGYSESGKRE
jgi:DNA-binding IclR family transcriptional regulator